MGRVRASKRYAARFLRVPRPEAPGHERLNRLADQLPPGVAKEPLRLRVEKDDLPFLVGG